MFACVFLLIYLLPGSAATPPQAPDAASALAERHRLLEVVERDGKDAVPILIDALKDDRKIVRLTAAHLIARLGDSAKKAIGPAMASADVEVRHVAIDVLADTGGTDRYVKQLLTNKEASVRRRFFLELLPDHLLVDGQPPDELIRTFESVYRDGPDQIRGEIIRAVSKLPLTDASIDLLERARDDDDPDIAKRARVTTVEEKMRRFKQLIKEKQYTEMLDAFETQLAEKELDTWPEKLAYKAFSLRSRAHRQLDQPEKALKDLETALSYWPSQGAYYVMGDIYRDDLNDRKQALDAFKTAVATRVGRRGSVLNNSILAAAAILRQRGQTSEALAILKKSRGNIDKMRGYWGFRFRCAYAQTLAAQGDYEAAISHYRQVLKQKDGFSAKHRKHAEQAIEKLREEL